MVDVKELLSTTPETLAAKQHEALLEEVKATLGRLILHLQKSNYIAAKEMLEASYAGDGNGRENRCISFNHLLEPVGGEFTDIGDVIERLESLSKHLAKKK